MKKIIVVAMLAIVGLSGSTQTYTVFNIPYNPFPYDSGSAILVNIDDIWSQAIHLPFTFNFFGTDYNAVVIGANSIISFDTIKNQPGTFCPWDITTAGKIPTTKIPLCSIMGPYQDIDPTNAGSIYWRVYGASPNRAFVISYYDVPYYGGTGSVNTNYCTTPPIYATNQVALYESTNIIDIYIKHKYICSGWNGELAFEGIQNDAGSAAYSVPGRNDTIWTDSLDAWRFTYDTLVNIIDQKNQYDLENTLKIFPNPATSVIEIFPEQAVKDIEIYNSMGELVSGYQYTYCGLQVTVNIKDLPGGVYLIKAKNEKIVIANKFVKQ